MNDLEKRIEALENQLLMTMEEKAREYTVLKTVLGVLIFELDKTVPNFSSKLLHTFLLEFIEQKTPGTNTGTIEQYKELVNNIIARAS